MKPSSMTMIRGRLRWYLMPLRPYLRPLRPYVDWFRAVSGGAPAATSLDINELLHHSRGAMLRAMPPGARRLLSAGCAGTWYFRWIEDTYGRVPEHLGIEYYSPRPDDLPSNVTWIANTASDMRGVEDGSCDLVFSGQNLEHLWPEEVAGFVLEAARVLRPGGHLVIDSPNRLMTAPLVWSHPEHTIELTTDEAVHLVTLAGFNVTTRRGIWLCRDPRDGAILPFDPNLPAGTWTVTERLIHAYERSADSFIWWIEAVRAAREPDHAAVHAFTDDLFRQHWGERVQRFQTPAGFARRQSADGEWVDAGPGQAGAALFGPYMPLRAGRYRVSWHVRQPEGATEPGAICDVLARDSDTPIASLPVDPGEQRPSIEFTLPDTTFGLQFRCIATARRGFSVLRRIELEELDTTAGP